MEPVPKFEGGSSSTKQFSRYRYLGLIKAWFKGDQTGVHIRRKYRNTKISRDFHFVRAVRITIKEQYDVEVITRCLCSCPGCCNYNKSSNNSVPVRAVAIIIKVVITLFLSRAVAIIIKVVITLFLSRAGDLPIMEERAELRSWNTSEMLSKHS